MDIFTKYFLVLVIPFFINTNSAFAMNSAALVPILNIILTPDENAFKNVGPRRVNIGGGAEYSISGDLIRRSANGTQATFEYDSLDRLTVIVITDISEPSDSLSLVFTYTNSLDERLSRIESTAVSSGVVFNAEVNFEYSSNGQFNSQTNGSYEVPAPLNSGRVISTVSVAYEPVYVANTLVRINTRLRDDLGSPVINNVMNIAYNDGVVSEIISESSVVESRRINRRENLSPFQQQITDQLISSDGDTLFASLDTASYEEVECTDSNRLLEENLSTLSLFYPPLPSAFFFPEICRD